jgi:hypothetical protein
VPAADRLEPEAITTVYLQYDAAVRLDLPFYALLDDAGQHHWGQFVFDRGQLDAEQPACWPWSSAPPPRCRPAAGTLAKAVAVQLAVVFRCRNWAVRLVQGHHRKTRHLRQHPGLQRRPSQPACPVCCWPATTAGDYPATLEGARSAAAAAITLTREHRPVANSVACSCISAAITWTWKLDGISMSCTIGKIANDCGFDIAMNKQHTSTPQQACRVCHQTVAATLAYYEQRFIDGLVAGRSEAEVYQELDRHARSP